MTTDQRVSRAVHDVVAERQRQIDEEGWTPEHDDEHRKNELARAAGCYAVGRLELTVFPPSEAERGSVWPVWPWRNTCWKPGNDRRQQLVKAGALLLAEIERLDRREARIRDAEFLDTGQ